MNEKVNKMNNFLNFIHFLPDIIKPIVNISNYVLNRFLLNEVKKAKL